MLGKTKLKLKLCTELVISCQFFKKMYITMAYQLSKEAKVNFVPLKNFLDKIILNLQQTVILREFAKSKAR